jgi:hypothetical protein
LRIVRALSITPGDVFYVSFYAKRVDANTPVARLLVRHYGNGPHSFLEYNFDTGEWKDVQNAKPAADFNEYSVEQINDYYLFKIKCTITLDLTGLPNDVVSFVLSGGIIDVHSPTRYAAPYISTDGFGSPIRTEGGPATRGPEYCYFEGMTPALPTQEATWLMDWESVPGTVDYSSIREFYCLGNNSTERLRTHKTGTIAEVKYTSFGTIVSYSASYNIQPGENHVVAYGWDYQDAERLILNYEIVTNGTVLSGGVWDATSEGVPEHLHSTQNRVDLLRFVSSGVDNTGIVYKIAAYDVKLSSQNMITLTKPQV